MLPRGDRRNVKSPKHVGESLDMGEGKTQEHLAVKGYGRGSLASSQCSAKGGKAMGSKGKGVILGYFKFNRPNDCLEDWLNRCAVGRLHEGLFLSDIEPQLGQEDVVASGIKVWAMTCSIDFHDIEGMKDYLVWCPNMLGSWLNEMCLWKDSDLARLNRFWFCFSGVPSFLWHDEFFKSLGAKFGEVLEISWRTIDKRDLREAWVRIKIWKGIQFLPSLVVGRNWGSYLMCVRIFSAWDVPARGSIETTTLSPSLSDVEAPMEAGRSKTWRRSGNSGTGGGLRMVLLWPLGESGCQTRYVPWMPPTSLSGLRSRLD